MRGFDHTGITVSDLEAALAVWCGVFGFELLYRTRREGAYAAGATGVAGAEIDIAMLEGGGGRIELLRYRAPAGHAGPSPRPCNPSATHLALITDDLDGTFDRLRKHGWTAAGPPQVRPGGVNNRVVYARDRDGLTVELIEPPR